ncbi:uncharacterized protein [Rutidosis leptorrhynchoides]|uniref:uncharacterized protein n=1 Tax=Rutidosis leptorrhynchoides TaxID=125765 RepID=UPI003A99EB10
MEEEDKDQIIIGSSTPIDAASKFVIKLKIAKKLENHTIETSKMLKEAKRVCPECNKEFSSGKALGGHMRIHAQSFNSTNPNNFLKIKKYKKHHHHQQQEVDDDMTKKMVMNKNKKPYYLSCVNSEGEPTCSQCGKTFPSMKSLFGHMRCHPERIWRGILPPPNITINRSFVGSSSSSVTTNQEDDEVIDLGKFLRGWGATERRGRPSLKSDNSEDEDGVLLEAVEDLMSLCQGQLKMDQLDHDYCNDDQNSDSGVIDTKQQQQVVYKSPNKINKRKKMKLMMDLEPDLSPNAVSMKEQEEIVVAVGECKYKCSTCNRCFTSHQALGGHRSSHNKVRMTSSSIDHNHELQGDQFGIGSSFEFAGVHQCKICEKVFATGQALGGHKRCHWTGINEPQQVLQVQVTDQADHSSLITSTGEDSGSGRKFLDFDLNEIPGGMMEEDEAGIGIEIGLGNGYASSSYNSDMLILGWCFVLNFVDDDDDDMTCNANGYGEMGKF